MTNWHPKAIWHQVCEAVREWMGPQEEEDAQDPNLLFHLAFVAPLLLGILALMRRAWAAA